MLRVTIDVVPGGDENEKHTVRMIEISNVQPPDELGDALHDYEARVDTGEVVGFAHVRAAGVEACVWQALDALISQRAKR